MRRDSIDCQQAGCHYLHWLYITGGGRCSDNRCSDNRYSDSRCSGSRLRQQYWSTKQVSEWHDPAVPSDVLRANRRLRNCLYIIIIITIIIIDPLTPVV